MPRFVFFRTKLFFATKNYLQNFLVWSTWSLDLWRIGSHSICLNIIKLFHKYLCFVTNISQISIFIHYILCKFKMESFTLFFQLPSNLVVFFGLATQKTLIRRCEDRKWHRPSSLGAIREKAADPKLIFLSRGFVEIGTQVVGLYVLLWSCQLQEAQARPRLHIDIKSIY